MKLKFLFSQCGNPGVKPEQDGSFGGVVWMQAQASLGRYPWILLNLLDSSLMMIF